MPPVNRKFIEQEWLRYKPGVMPKDAGPTQIIQSRRAFYAGAQALFGIVTGFLSPGDKATSADIVNMESLLAELDDFARMVLKGKA